MKKIEIITFNRAHNYGALLQLYALQKKLSNKYYVEALDYRCENIEREYKIITLKNKKLINKFKAIARYVICGKKAKNRYNNFNDFIEKKIKLSDSIYDKKDIINKCKNVDVFIAGSDQIWNKNIVGELSDIYTLNFDYPNTNKISYAASVGDIKLITENQNEFKEKLNNLYRISVREENAKEELSKILDKQIEVVLDPTLLLKREEWENDIKELKKEDSKYIFAYVVTPDENFVKIVNELSKKTGLKVIYSDIVNKGYSNPLKTMYTEGPLEFVNYIKNAEYVVSTSFHATVFSIIFNKKFFIIPHKKTGDRVTNLLNKLNIEGRTFNSYEDFKNIDYDFETNWSVVNKKLDEEREKSINWLDKALNG